MLTKGERRSIERLVAYTDFTWPTDRAIEMYVQVTEQGVSPFAPGLHDGATPEDMIHYKCLIEAHEIASKKYSALFEELLVDGWKDLPIGRILIESLARDKETWFRKLPEFERLYRLVGLSRRHQLVFSKERAMVFMRPMLEARGLNLKPNKYAR